jgi:hypothetical protein
VRGVSGFEKNLPALLEKPLFFEICASIFAVMKILFQVLPGSGRDNKCLRTIPLVLSIKTDIRSLRRR